MRRAEVKRYDGREVYLDMYIKASDVDLLEALCDTVSKDDVLMQTAVQPLRQLISLWDSNTGIKNLIKKQEERENEDSPF